MSYYPDNRGQDGGRYEMTNFNAASRSYDNLTANPDSTAAFYDEISNVQDLIRTFNANILKISELHTRSLNGMDETAQKRSAGQLEELMDETSGLSNELKRRIKTLQAQRRTGADAQARAQQIDFVKSKFVESIQGYQQVEREYRQKYRQRIERQMKIVKPDATPEEIKAAAESDDAQVFTQELLNSNRLGESRAAYREVQERHANIKKIEKTLTELAQLFNDMSLAVEQQQDTIDVIHNNALNIDTDVETGLKHTETAVKSARGARSKRWWLFWIVVVIVLIIILIIVVQLHPWAK
ncbi:syntaxin-like protein [Exidia glandulosa HHB12029]|uniref:Syntaxin-like protein n=1 Tax=Exidia glandulosa HHB12029 TaxID=1314781 RepID=A0A165F3K4_EXIGL|nr:syntaxin-like protein [Exidia glandulosa HHB12029]